MYKLSKKTICLALAMLLVVFLASCTTTTEPEETKADTTAAPAETTETATEAEAPAEKTYDEEITIDMFNSQANYQGIQAGWYGNVVKDKFNMIINIIAPNVAGGGDTLFQTRSAAGELGDIVMIGAENGRLADTVTAGLLMDITDMVAETEYLVQYQSAIDNISKLIESDRVYAIPSSVSSQSPLTPSEGVDLTYGPYIRWDLYTALGSPELKTLEDLLPLFKDMQELEPTSDTGKKTYAISLFKDWDGNMMCLAKQPACFYGIDEQGFLLLAPDGTTQSIIDDDSLYVRSLKFYYDANQMGLLDPDSTTQNWDTLWAKYQDGQILYAPWPWLGQAAYNTPERKDEGKGFMIAPVEDIKIFSYGCNPLGSKYVISVGIGAEDPQRMIDFIDWMYSPDGIMLSSSQTGSTCGPQDVTWEMVDGRPVLTDFGTEAFSGSSDLEMPEMYGGGSWQDGVSQLNYQAVLASDINPLYGEPYNPQLWTSTLESKTTPLDKSWQEAMGALTTLEYLAENDGYVVAAGNGYIPEASPAEIDTIRNQCKAIIVENSWKMVFAEDEDEFYSLLAEMQETVVGLGYDDVLAFDQSISDQLTAARNESIEMASGN